LTSHTNFRVSIRDTASSGIRLQARRSRCSCAHMQHSRPISPPQSPQSSPVLPPLSFPVTYTATRPSFPSTVARSCQTKGTIRKTQDPNPEPAAVIAELAWWEPGEGFQPLSGGTAAHWPCLSGFLQCTILNRIIIALVFPGEAYD
jgi:hypothetical protein